MMIFKKIAAKSALSNFREEAIKMAAQKMGTEIMLVDAGMTLEEAEKNNG